MIDLHCHIIPGVDDGAPDMETSLKMIRMAGEDGITAMVATPHVNSTSTDPGHLTRILTNFENLKNRLVKEGVDMPLYLGSEIYLDELILDNLDKYQDILSINNSRYVMVEFPMHFVYPGSTDHFTAIMDQGYIPVISHPERNLQIQRDPALLYRFLTIGCLTQLNAGSLKGDFGTAAMHSAFLFLKKNWIQVIATDAHDHRERVPALGYLRELPLGISREKLDLLLHEIPHAIIHDRDLPFPGPLKDPRSRLFHLFSSRKKEKE